MIGGRKIDPDRSTLWKYQVPSSDRDRFPETRRMPGILRSASSEARIVGRRRELPPAELTDREAEELFVSALEVWSCIRCATAVRSHPESHML